ncbi:uncharacterized mitochondrial protein-like protein [Tanacetum coccineum]
MVPRTVLTRSGPISLNAARPVNTVQPRTAVNNAGPMKNVINNAYSTARRPFNKITGANNSNFNKRVNTVNDKNVNAARPNAVVNTARPKAVLSAVKGNKGNVVKASACWVWRPKHKVLDHVSKNNGASMSFKRKQILSYKLMKDLLPLKELKFNLFSISQMCDKKNSVLFTDTECVVLSPYFKLTDESHVLLKVSRKDNISLDKFDGTAMKGFFVGYSTMQRFRRSGPNWLFDIDALTNSMNYKPVVAGNQSNGNISTKACDNAGKARMETVPGKDYILLPMWPAGLLFSQNLKESPDAGYQPIKGVPSTEEPREDQRVNQELDASINSTKNINTASDGNSTNNVNVVSSTVNAAGTEVNIVNPKTSIELPNDPNMPELEEIVYSDNDEDVGAEADINNLDEIMPYSVQQRTNYKDFQNCLLACFLSQEEPKKVLQAFTDPRYTKEEGIDYDEVFAPVTRIEAIRLFLAYASFKHLVVYQMDVKSVFLYGKIEEEVYVCQPPGFEDPDFPDRKFGFSDVKTASTPMETHKPLLKDADGEDVDEHMYRSMIGSLMYLTSSRPDIIYLKGQPKLGLWYPRDSLFDSVAYIDSEYVGASLDRKSTTRGCQFLGCRLISWQCKKQIVVANSTTEAKYVAASS